MKFQILLISFWIFAASCSVSHESKSESLGYEFELNGCPTGKREFSSKADMCQGLQNNNLNNGCALGMREEYFKAQCPGQDFNPYWEENGTQVFDFESSEY